MLRRSGFGRLGRWGKLLVTTRCHHSNYCNRLLGVQPSSQQNRRLGLVDLHPFILEPQRKRIRTKHGGSRWPIKFWFWVSARVIVACRSLPLLKRTGPISSAVPVTGKSKIDSKCSEIIFWIITSFFYLRKSQGVQSEARGPFVALGVTLCGLRMQLQNFLFLIRVKKISDTNYLSFYNQDFTELG